MKSLALALLSLAFYSDAEAAIPNLPGSEDRDSTVVESAGVVSTAIEIPAPTGTARFEPTLELVYASDGGDGPFGIGWSVPLGEVARSTRFGVPAFDDALDTFELGGELLVASGELVGGSTRFHTMTETFHRVLMNPDNSWEVQFPDGRRARFGQTEAARLTGSHGTDPTVRWLITELEDSSGNVITFEYDNLGDEGAAYPSEVSYTTRNGAPVGALRRIEFLYESRTDTTRSFRAGVPTSLGHRVREIRTTAGGDPVRRILLAYESVGAAATYRSRLIALHEFGADCPVGEQDPFSGCAGLPVRRFEYTDPSDHPAFAGSPESAQWSTPPAGEFVAPIDFDEGSGIESGTELGVRFGDLNGDGLVDIVRAYDDGSQFVHEVYLNRGNSWDNTGGDALAFAASLASLTMPTMQLEGHSSWVPATTQLAFARSEGWDRDAWDDPYLPPTPSRMVDMTGDGRADIVASVRFWDTGSYSSQPAVFSSVWVNTGNGWCGPNDLGCPSPDALATAQALSPGLPAIRSFEVFAASTSFPSSAYGLYPEIACVEGDCFRAMINWDEGVEFPDLNGDGAADVVAKRQVNPEFVQGSNPLNHAPLHYGDAYDSAQIQASGSWQLADQYLLPTALNGLACDASSNISHNVDFAVRFVDLNGDTLDDLVKTAPEMGSSVQADCFPSSGLPAIASSDQHLSGVWLNTGLGWCGQLEGCSAAQSMLPPAPFTRYDDGFGGWGVGLASTGTVFADVNGDSLPDLIRADGTSEGVRGAWLNDPGAAGWTPDSRFLPPVGLELLVDSPQGAPAGNGVRALDADGDQIVDFVRAYAGEARTSEVSQFSYSDRLRLVDNGNGGVERFEYQSAAQALDTALETEAILDFSQKGEEKAGSWLLGGMPVVVRRIVTGIDGESFEWTYSYAHRRFCHEHKSALGFRVVEVVGPDRRERQFHYQNHGHAGRPSKQEIYSHAGDLLWRHTIDREVVDGAHVVGSVADAFVSRIVLEASGNQYSDGPGSQRAVTYDYDDSGVGYGFVTGLTISRPTGGVEVAYLPEAPDTTNWIVGLVSEEEHRSNGTLYRRWTNSYLPGRNLLVARTYTLQERSASPGVPSYLVETWDYDELGNLRSKTDLGGRTESYCYDGDLEFPGGGSCPAASDSVHANVTAIRDAIGNQTSAIVSPGTGALLDVTRPNGDRVVFGRDGFERLTTLTFTAAGDAPLLLRTLVYHDGLATPAGRSFSEVFEETGTDTIRRAAYRDAFGRIVRVVVDGPSESAGYVGELIARDHQGRVVARSYPGSCDDEHCAGGNVQNEPAISLSLDELGRIRTRNSGDGIRSVSYGRRIEFAAGPHPGGEFDVEVVKDPRGGLVRRVRDGDRIVWVDECQNAASPGAIDPGLNCVAPDRTLFVFAPSGEVERIFDAVATQGSFGDPRHRTVRTHDTLGRETQVEDSSGGVIQRVYNAEGTLESVTNARQQTIQLYHDDIDRLTKVVSPEDTINVTYDPVTRRRDREASASGFYEVTWDYDSLGRVARTTRTAGSVVLITDQVHDLSGRLVRIDYPTESTSVLYEFEGQYLRRVCESNLTCGDPNAKSIVDSVTYDGSGRVSSVGMPPGTVTTDYNPETHRVHQKIVDSITGARELDLTYSYDEAGNLTSVLDGHETLPLDGLDGGSTFDYDVRSRISGWGVGSAIDTYFAYDSVGNLVGRQLPSPGGSDQSFVHPDKPHAVTTSAGGTTFAYDEDGNVIRRGTQYLGWDSSDRLTCIGDTVDCDDVSFVYSLDGEKLRRRDASSGTVYDRHFVQDVFEWRATAQKGTINVYAFGLRIYSKQTQGVGLRSAEAQLVLWRMPRGGAFGLLVVSVGAMLGWGTLRGRETWSGVATGAVASGLAVSIAFPGSVYGGGDPNGGGSIRRWFFSDHVGTTVLSLDGNGGVVDRTVIDPFGSTLAGLEGGESESAYFAGHFHDPSAGLIDFGGRWYDPAAGRFLNVDPFIQEAFDPQTHNAYGYVRNNPGSYVDPDGRFFGIGFNIPLYLAGFTSAEIWVEFSLPFFVNDQVLTIGVTADYAQSLVGNDPGSNSNPSSPEGPGLLVPAGAVTAARSVLPSNEPGQPDTPDLDAPLGVDIQKSVETAHWHKFNVWWFEEQVQSDGPWDFKTEGLPGQYEAFGNWHYGVVGKALGVPERVLLKEAGRAHRADNPDNPQPGDPGSRWNPFDGTEPFGDDADDQKWIKRGFDYFDAYEQGR